MGSKMQPPERPTISPSLRLMNKLATSPSVNPLKVKGGVHVPKKSTSPNFMPQRIFAPQTSTSDTYPSRQEGVSDERAKGPSPLATSPLFEHMQGLAKSISSQGSDSGSSFRQSPLPGSSKLDKDLPQLPPPQDENSGDNAIPLLFGLGVNGTAGAIQDESVAGPSTDSSYSWNHRRAAMKAAGQQASAGLMKFGKASAAKLKQAQQRPHNLHLMRNRDVGGTSPTGNLMGALGISNGLRRYDGRASKSMADLSISARFNEDIPSMPVFRTPDPNIGLPTDVKHNVHVDVGPNGYTGLPASWAQVLSQCGIDKEDVKRNPAQAAKLVQEKTEYYISKEAEQGNDIESARRLLKSRLDDFTELKDAVNNNNPSSRERENSANDVTPKAAVRKGLKHLQASTSYNTSLDALWPSLTSSSSIKGHNLNNDASPVLPEVAADEDDWVSSLLNSIPASTSNSSILSRRRRSALKRRSRSVDGLDFDLVTSRIVPPELEIEEQLQDHQEEFDINSDQEYSEDDEIAATSSISTAKMQVNGFAKPYLTSSASSSLLGSRDQIVSRRKSDEKSASTQSHDHYSLSNDAAVSPCGSSTGDTSYFANTMQTSSSPLPTLSASTSPSPSSADRPSTASDNGHMGLGLGLRDRRKASPRIYPPAVNKYVPKEDNLSPFSAYGFKRGSAGGYSDASATPQSIVARSRHQVVPSQSSLDRESNSSHSQYTSNRGLPRDRLIATKAGSENLSINGSSIDEVSLRSFNTDKDRQKRPEGPPLPPKAARVPIGHTPPDFILPDESGFYNVDKRKQEQHVKMMGTAPSIQLELNPKMSTDDNDLSRDPSPIMQQSPLYSVLNSHLPPQRGMTSSSTSSNQQGNHQSIDRDQKTSPLLSPMLQEDNQHGAADFIEDWLKNDYTSEPLSPTGTTFSSPRGHYSYLPVSSSPRQIVSPQHQSPSPALLQALPFPYRNFHSAPLKEINPAVMNKINVDEEKKDVIGWKQQFDDTRTNGEDCITSDRDWRIRSLPPPPLPSSDLVEIDADVKENEEQNERASVLSLPSEMGSPMVNRHSPSMGTVNNSRPNSRQSRSSSRTGSRRVIHRITPRRSSDAKRFPVSMHYASGVNSDVFDYDQEGEGFNFAEMVKARQSLDLDDVMPSSLSQNDVKMNAQVPPVPPLPIKRSSLDQQAVQRARELPESGEHLRSFLRFEDPRSIVGNLVIIGEGESGHVYSTIPRSTCDIYSLKGRGKVAVKIVQIPQDLKETTGRFAKLDEEVTIWKAAQEHGNVVNLYDVFISHEPEANHPGIWIFQEFMSMSLADVVMIKSSGLEVKEEQMSRIMLDTVLALDHLHYNQILHRDVRSDNILLTFDGVSKLTDFTHAIRRKKSEKISGVVGTAYWMAPEVIKGEEYDEKVDIWSLGVVLFELIEGFPPRVDEPPLQAIELTTKLGLPNLSQPSRHSAALRQCLSWCTEMDPEMRPTAEALPNSEFLSSPGSYSQIADLMEEARSIEASAESFAAEEETLDDGIERGRDLKNALQVDDAASVNIRDSWNSQDTIHA